MEAAEDLGGAIVKSVVLVCVCVSGVWLSVCVCEKSESLNGKKGIGQAGEVELYEWFPFRGSATQTARRVLALRVGWPLENIHVRFY